MDASISLKVPFGSDKNRAAYQRGMFITWPQDSPDIDIEWRDNIVFEDTMILTLHDYRREAFVRSATTNLSYIFPLRLVNILLYDSDVINGRITGKWTYYRRGRHYGVTYITPHGDPRV